MRFPARTFTTRFLLIWAAWTGFAVFTAGQNFLTRAYSQRVSFLPALRYALLDAYVWAALTPIVLFVSGRLLVTRAQWRRNLPLLFLAGMVFTIVHLAVFLRLLPWIGYRNTPAVNGIIARGEFHSDLLTCWALVALRHGIEYYRQVRVRELAASQLEAKLAVSQLEVLKMQLQPHFLFNTLHAISALMYRNLEGADRMIARLSDFLRLTLDSAGVQEVTLKREMEYLDKYLEIEQVRFGERLEVQRSIQPEALDLRSPTWCFNRWPKTPSATESPRVQAAGASRWPHGSIAVCSWWRYGMTAPVRRERSGKEWASPTRAPVWSNCTGKSTDWNWDPAHRREASGRD